jgi:ribonuclease D
MPTSEPNSLLVDQQPGLNRVCEAIASGQQVAIDTEFVRTSTYAPHLGLIQITANELTACIDPLADMDMAAFWTLLFDPERTCLIHSGSQDMEVLWYTCKQVIPNIIDTQVCSAMLGYPAQIGYAGLAGELVNADIKKDQTRTDWTRRPLTEAQITYAAEDVIHLPRMHELLKERLTKLGRYDWAVEDSKYLSNISLYKPDSDSAWQRIKSIPFLPVAQQARARALAAWREQRAVNSDKPRGWILADKPLLQLAEKNPASSAAMDSIEDLPKGLIRNQGEKLLAILSEANKKVAAGAVDYKQEIPDRDKDKARVKKCSQIIRAQAEELEITPEVIGSKRDIQALIKTPDQARLNRGWRKILFGNKLLDVI